MVLQWSSDLIEKGLSLGSPGAAQVVKKYTTLNQLAPKQCSDVLTAARGLALDANCKVVGKDVLIGKLGRVVGSDQYSSLGAFKVAAWKKYLEARLTAVEGLKPEDGQQGFLDSIKAAVFFMPNENLGQQSSTMVPFKVTTEALRLLEGDDRNKFVASLGHQLLESYSEKASLSAIWHLQIPESLINDSTSTQKDLESGKRERQHNPFYDLRMRLQKYFLTPRTVSEVCSFLGAPEDSFHDIQTIPNVKVSIFGYRDEFTKEPLDLNEKSPSLAAHYLTQDALFRNVNRVAITMRPWQGLQISDRTPPDDHLGKEIPPVAPEEFFVLNTQKAQRLLLLLKIYSEVPDPKVEPKDLPAFGKTLDKILDPNSLDVKTGKMLTEPKELLTQLVRDLEKVLPASDPESTKEALKAIN